MEFDNIQILGCKIAKVTTMDYHSNLDGFNYSVDNDDTPHPDLRNAMLAFASDFAEAYYILGKEKDKFIPDGFTITEAKGIHSITISGKILTHHDEKVSTNSGKIKLSGVDSLETKLKRLRTELFAFFYKGKSAQLDWVQEQEKAEQEKQEKKEEPAEAE